MSKRQNPDEALRLVGLNEFVTRPQMSWLVRDMIPPESIVIVFGPPKGGKTFTMTDVLMHAAHGMDWHGRAVPKPVRVALLVGEGRKGFKVRLQAWLEHHDAAELTGDFRLLPEALSLPARVHDVVEALLAYRPDIVAVDTLNAYFGAGDENSTQDMTAFVSAVRQIRDQVGCTVIALHHTGLADKGRERGSGVLRGAADVVIQVGKDEGDSGLVGVQVVTGRDIEEWERPVALRLRRIETEWRDDDGRQMATCIVEAGNMPVTLSGRGPKLGKAQRFTVEVVEELAAMEACNGEAILCRADIAKAVEVRGGNRSAAYRHLNQLLARIPTWRLVEPGCLKVTGLSRVAPVAPLGACDSATTPR